MLDAPGAVMATSLNESPSEKEGKSVLPRQRREPGRASMKVPPKRKGNAVRAGRRLVYIGASMKVPPKRKGNAGCAENQSAAQSLNESPSEKEGKSPLVDQGRRRNTSPQ